MYADLVGGGGSEAAETDEAMCLETGPCERVATARSSERATSQVTDGNAKVEAALGVETGGHD